MQFQLLPSTELCQDARFDECLVGLAAENGPTACVWESRQGLVVPRTYQRHANFSASCASFAAQGWPVTVRQSGGGIVPQGAGIINLSMAYAVEGKPLDHSDDAYLLVCRVMTEALREFGIASHPQAVEGSFCDGRYNLAVGHGPSAKKVAGTAQLWRRQAGTTSADARQIVLVHGLILAEIDCAALTRLANRFEQSLDTERRYSSDKIASLHDLITPAGTGGGLPFTRVLNAALERQILSLQD